MALNPTRDMVPGRPLTGLQAEALNQDLTRQNGATQQQVARLKGPTSAPISSVTIPLAQLTTDGAPGSIQIVNGLVVSVTHPT